MILGLIFVVCLQPSFRKMVGLGWKVEAESATKRVLLTDPFGHSPEVSFSFFNLLFPRAFLLS